MSDPDDDRILSYLRGEAGEADLRDLARRLETGDEAARKLAARISDDALLAGWFRSEADPGFVEETAAAAGIPMNDPDFVAGTLQRIDRRRRARPVPAPEKSFPFAFVAAAAVLLLGFGLLLWSSLSPAPTPRPLVVLPRPPERPVENPAPTPVPEAPRPQKPAPPVVAPAPIPRPRTPMPAPQPTEPPLPVPRSAETPVPAPAPVITLVTVARFERVEGEVSLVSSEGRVTVAPLSDLPPGRSVDVGKSGRASLKFADATTLDLGPGTRLDEISDGEGGKRLTLAQGSLSADVAKQPAGRSFVIQTPHAEARVVGTILKLTVDATATRLDVTEGKVRLTRPDKKSIEVGAGHFAASTDLVSRSLEGFTLKDIPSAGLALWLKADSGVTTVGGAVSQWVDQSGNRREATQDAPEKRPLLIADAVRGRPALRFDGKDDVLSASVPIEGLGGLTMILVASNSTDYAGGAVHGENAALFWAESTEWGWVYLSPFQSNVKFRFGTTQPNNLPFHIRSASTSGFTVTTAIKDGPVESLYIQGVPVERLSGKAPALKGTTPALQIGAGARNTAFPGDIAEILIYTRAITDGERQRLERALIAKYFR
jgi:hypothetical protein